MKLYTFDYQTKEYIGEIEISDPRPYDPRIPGNSTSIKPPVTEEGQEAKWHGQGWDVFDIENELDDPPQPTIDEIKERKIAELNAGCQATICSGFYSSALLGEPHKYESKIEDQINLMGAVQMGVDMLYRCWNPEGTKQEWYQHTTAQLKQVFADGSVMVRQNLERVSNLKEQVAEAGTIEEIESIIW